MMTTPISGTPSRFVRWSLIVGIIIVLNMFFNYAISLVYKAPVYPMTQPQVVGTYTKESCLAVGGQWTETPTALSLDKLAPTPTGGYCDPQYTARNAYDAAHTIYQRNVFIILMTLGVITLLLGVFVSHDIVATAFSWGGVVSLVIASMRYWSQADNLVKVLLLALALVALIWVAVKKFASSAAV